MKTPPGCVALSYYVCMYVYMYAESIYICIMWECIKYLCIIYIRVCIMCIPLEAELLYAYKCVCGCL